MDKNELFDNMKLPGEKDCFNCVHGPVADKCRINGVCFYTIPELLAGGKELSDISPHALPDRPSGWEWNE